MSVLRRDVNGLTIWNVLVKVRFFWLNRFEKLWLVKLTCLFGLDKVSTTPNLIKPKTVGQTFGLVIRGLFLRW